eukprot:TRINITY_DN75538_c0_g1_i1.p1 TRINITY_DN75538_c0_g1~~TRINITY_DN75538_c0_g1_i1.p1  ORF type:complete len:415 (-),score=43.30 TRINITY_DN75538_c0_g1_i1:232-1398(-)
MGACASQACPELCDCSEARVDSEEDRHHLKSYKGERQHDGRIFRYDPVPRNLERAKWVSASPSAAQGIEDWSLNPILPSPGWADWIVGDPTVLRIGNEIHLWANAALADIRHWVADVRTPTVFTQMEDSVQGFGAVRPFAFHNKERNTVTLFYEQYSFPGLSSSRLVCREADVGSWQFCDAETVLQPELEWEKVGIPRLGSPFVFYNHVKKKYWLYYSAGKTRLTDSGLDETVSIGLAEADDPYGPYTRVRDEPISIEGGIPGLNTLGHGSLKVLRRKGAFIDESGVGVAACNQVSFDPKTRCTSSRISLLSTSDGGLSWHTVNTSLIGPTGEADSWKQAYVNAFDTLLDPNDSSKELIYYAARNGYSDAFESVGVSRLPVSLIENAV